MDEKVKATWDDPQGAPVKKSAEAPQSTLKFAKLTLLPSVGALGHAEFRSFRFRDLRDADFFTYERKSQSYRSPSACDYAIFTGRPWRLRMPPRGCPPSSSPRRCGARSGRILYDDVLSRPFTYWRLLLLFRKTFFGEGSFGRDLLPRTPLPRRRVYRHFWAILGRGV